MHGKEVHLRHIPSGLPVTDLVDGSRWKKPCLITQLKSSKAEDRTLSLSGALAMSACQS